jgi:RNA polymerase sigma-70 factor, ECF subfamily
MLEIAMTPLRATYDDYALIQLAVAGQAECFTVLMDRHLAAVRRRIGWMARGAADAEDLLQDVLLKVWHRLSTFRSESSFRTWMTHVAINEALQSYRRECRSPFCPAICDLDAFASPDELPHRSFVRVEATQAVRGAVATLPAKYRQVLILRNLRQLNAGEIARRLQTSVPAVKTRLFRARRMLLAVLERAAKVSNPAAREPVVRRYRIRS